MKKIIAAILLLLTAAFVFFGWQYFAPVGSSEDLVVFVVPEKMPDFNVPEELYKQKYIKSSKAFRFLLENFAPGVEIKPGGYKISQNMNAWQVMKKITGQEDLKWVTISYCPRKEQVGEKLAEVLGWNDLNLSDWNSLYKNTKQEYFEGVYYPDTYLIPVDESPSQVAGRFINRFNEKFAPLSEKFIEKNIKWTTGLKIASLIAREAGGTEDMNIISAVIWNRLDGGMPLQIDATMQYTLGKNEDGSWWGNIDLSEKDKDSPYNSYMYKGLPPTPICSPNVSAIEAVINPEETDCLFYLHDKNKNIHCAVSYKDHLKNIQKYLK
ncbi:MAG TPA: endolytic transglycosylase MltG [Patescibacteria group bacterium]|nr:endolytic transglycosylase MltG [Patescibacteria group bacterium]